MERRISLVQTLSLRLGGYGYVSKWVTTKEYTSRCTTAYELPVTRHEPGDSLLKRWEIIMENIDKNPTDDQVLAEDSLKN